MHAHQQLASAARREWRCARVAIVHHCSTARLHLPPPRTGGVIAHTPCRHPSITIFSNGDDRSRLALFRHPRRGHNAGKRSVTLRRVGAVSLRRFQRRRQRPRTPHLRFASRLPEASRFDHGSLASSRVDIDLYLRHDIHSLSPAMPAGVRLGKRMDLLAQFVIG
jgi:hypothetical protein